MKKIKFVFAIHNHQPVGNFDHIAEEAYHNAYLPLVEAVNDIPWFKINLHFTGSLLEWILKSHPEFIKTVASMVDSGQAEVMGGGFYEPILALLPDEDKLGQIRKLSKFIEKHFGRKPRGIWLAERVWEPHLPAAISDAGIEYVVVDDFHFKMSGFRDSELTGYFITEEQGKTLKIFPGSERLRYTIPFKEPQETIQYWRNLPDAGENTLSVMADDGEKFGVWPGTFKWVYEDGWLRRFVKALEENADWVQPSTFSGYIDAEGPRGRAYLSTCSYMEMGEWSLPAGAMAEYEDFLDSLKLQPGFDINRLFVKGGFFRNFLSKYPESNSMHKRMLQVSRKAHESGSEEALDELWRGQCNDAYWHGVFGGLYLPHLRDAVYRHLIKAEIAAEAPTHPSGPPSPAGGEGNKEGKAGHDASGAPKNISPSPSMGEGRGEGESPAMEIADLDGDLSDEVMITNREIAIAVDPGEGGAIYELDYRPIAMNMMNNLSRRPEAYHRKLSDQYAAAQADGGRSTGGAATIHEKISAKEEGLFKYLHYDWYRKASLIDHFLDGEMDFEAFRNASHKELGNFVKGAYTHSVERQGDKVMLTLSHAGTVQGQRVVIKKRVGVNGSQSGFDADYILRNEGTDELNTVFGVEFNFSLLAGNSPDRYFEIPGHSLKANNFASAGELNNVQEVRMVDEWMKYALTLSFSEKAVLWRFPVETVSQSESGYERVFQCASVVPVWRVTLSPGADLPISIKLKLERR